MRDGPSDGEDDDGKEWEEEAAATAEGAAARVVSDEGRIFGEEMTGLAARGTG